MTEKDKLSEIIQETTMDTYNDNIEYLKKAFEEDILDGGTSGRIAIDEDFIANFMHFIIRTSMELSALNTMKILKKLNIDIEFPE